MSDGRDFIKIIADTILKRSTLQSRQITDSKSLYPCKAETEFTISSWSEEDNHVKFSLHETEIQGFNTWFCWKPHCELFTAKPENSSITWASKPADRGAPLQLPGLSQCVFLNDPVCAESPNFRWYEATRNGARIPPDSTVTAGIIRIAKAAQVARDKIGASFNITSWYRDPDTNWRVGGASASRHLWGDALDLWVEGFTGRELYHLLDPWWEGGTRDVRVYALYHPH